MAVQMLFQSDLGHTSIDTILSDFRPSDYGLGSPDAVEAEIQAPKTRKASEPADIDGAFDYAKSLVTGTLEHLEEIDGLIRQQAEHWRLERMPAVDRNILRLAIYEFLYETDVPKLVILDEAIELAKAFGSEQSGRFINGVLDGVLKSHTLPGSLT
jgi:N utilization substance protein B